MPELTLGEYILSGRTAAGLTREALAAALHVTSRDVSEWERNVTVPGYLMRRRLGCTLNLSVRELARLAPAGRRVFEQWIDWVFNLLPVGIGSAVVVLALAKKADLYTGLAMLGVGLVSVGINVRRKQ